MPFISLSPAVEKERSDQVLEAGIPSNPRMHVFVQYAWDECHRGWSMF